MSDYEIIIAIIAVVALIPVTWVPLHIFRVGRFNKAATIFRNKVLNALEGIYPVTNPWWDESVFPKFKQSVPIIETAVAEFRHFVKRKTELDTAVKKYHDYCQRRTYERGIPHMTYPNSPGIPKTETDPIEEFKNIVEHILSFADENEKTTQPVTPPDRPEAGGR